MIEILDFLLRKIKKKFIQSYICSFSEITKPTSAIFQSLYSHVRIWFYCPTLNEKIENILSTKYCMKLWAYDVPLKLELGVWFGWEKCCLENICDSSLFLQSGVVNTTIHLFDNKDDALFCQVFGKFKQLLCLRSTLYKKPDKY